MVNGGSFDVIVVGGGVIGAFIARELTKFQLSVGVVEAKADVATGASGANSAIVHGGFDPEPGTLKARFNVEGCQMMRRVTSELDVPFEMIGSLVVAQSDEEVEILKKLQQQGRVNGVKGLHLLDAWEVRGLESGLSKDVKAALLSSESGIVCPYELTQAAMENAMVNGAKLFLNAPVTAIERRKDKGFVVTAGEYTMETRVVVNAAGLYADRIYDMGVECALPEERTEAHQKRFKILPKAGEYMLLDKSEGMTVCHVIFRVPSAVGKGILVSPTVDGNLILGPTSVFRANREDTATTAEGLESVRAGAQQLVSDVNLRSVIKSFTGLRAASNVADHDFIIGGTPIEGFYNAAGIESPGLTSAPAIGVYMAQMIALDLGTRLNSKFNPRRFHMRFRDLSFEEQQDLVKEDPSYGQIVCRCETVTEGEIIEAIRRPCGARTVDGVKRRTRSGMGRCQGGFCSTRIVELLAQELGIDPTEVELSEPGSYILTGPTKQKGE